MAALMAAGIIIRCQHTPMLRPIRTRLPFTRTLPRISRLCPAFVWLQHRISIGFGQSHHGGHGSYYGGHGGHHGGHSSHFGGYGGHFGGHHGAVITADIID